MSSNEVITINLNHFDTEGNQVDSSTMDMSVAQAEDIIDHAAQLMIVIRDMARGACGIDAFDQVLSELEESLVVADVIAEDEHPLPVLGLLQPK
jgi:hypothetical protein